MYNKEKFEVLEQKYESDKKLSSILDVNLIIRLITLLEKKEIQDEEISNNLAKIYELLETYDHTDKTMRKEYRNAVSNLKSYVSSQYKLKPKGSISLMWFTICMALGIIFDVIGIAIGICVGFLVGFIMEKKADKELRIY